MGPDFWINLRKVRNLKRHARDSSRLTEILLSPQTGESSDQDIKKLNEELRRIANLAKEGLGLLLSSSEKQALINCEQKARELAIPQTDKLKNQLPEEAVKSPDPRVMDPAPDRPAIA